MSEETINTEQEEIIDADDQETVADNDEELSEEETQKLSDEKAKQSTISKIGKMVRNFVSGNDKDEDKDGADIPDEFTEATIKAGWTEEDIRTFASDYSDEELLEMIPSLTTDSVKTDETEEKSEKTEEKVEDSQEDEKTKKLLERIEALEKGQGKSQKEKEEQELIGRVQRAHQIFDEASKEFDVFGKTDELPKFPDGKLILTSPQMKARNEVWDLADLLRRSGMDFDKAMSVSLNSYKADLKPHLY